MLYLTHRNLVDPAVQSNGTWHEGGKCINYCCTGCLHTNTALRHVATNHAHRCGAEGVDVAINGIGECDYACAGDDTKICGGYWSFTVYDVGKDSDSDSVSRIILLA